MFETKITNSTSPVAVKTSSGLSIQIQEAGEENKKSKYDSYAAKLKRKNQKDDVMKIGWIDIEFYCIKSEASQHGRITKTG